MIPIVYHPAYNITAFGLERLHPFDSRKYRRIHDALIARGLRRSTDFIRPRPASRNDLLKVHSAEYLRSLRQAAVLARVLEVPVVAGLPAWLIDWRILRPMRYATGGTIVACRAALESRRRDQHRRWLSPCRGRVGWRVLRVCRRSAGREDPSRRGPRRQGDGRRSRRPPGKRHGLDFRDWPWAAIYDLYERDTFPAKKEPEDYPLPVRSGLTGGRVPANPRRDPTRGTRDVRPDLVVYNAGSDPFAGDPLAGFRLTMNELAERDLTVVTMARERNIPIAMVLSGGYSAESWRIHTESIEGILTRFDRG